MSPIKYTRSNLIVHPHTSADPDLITQVLPEQAGWQKVHFQARQLAAGRRWSFRPGAFEMALVPLSGGVRVRSNRGEWPRVGRRASVFAGLPEALYLPGDSSLEVEALEDAQFALAWAPAERDHPARLVAQDQVTVELRGGDNFSRHINGILRPGFDCDALVVVEVYTPGGNWSSYPPHKHDVHRTDASGALVEADLEEIYYYKIDPPAGFAIQRVYTGEGSPLQQAGMGFDELLLVGSDDLVIVPEGYHPVVSAPGYTSYYLNVLSGSAQALTAADDPAHSWVKGSYRSRDSRVPVYPVDPEQII